MEKLNVAELLGAYENWVKKGEIQFLPKNSSQQQRVLSLVKELSEDITIAIAKGGLSQNIDWREAHKKGSDLWSLLASSSLNYVDPNSRGNSQLFEFLEDATKFEDLLYGLEDYYRDHTLHSLWVYFIGEHILRDHLPEVRKNLNWYIFNDIEHDKDLHSRKLRNDSINRERLLCENVSQNRDAIWCIMALCHDLGYSLAKLERLNERVSSVLRHFDISNFQNLGYSLDVEHQYITKQFLELMAMDVRIVPSSDNQNVLIKCYRDDSTYWRLCRALEKKQHGVLSAYLLYKVLGVFAESWIRGTAEEWGLEDREAIDNVIRGDILFAISQHTFDFAYLHQIGSLADILFIADELEEFSRFGRQLLSRSYHDTTAEAMIDFIKNRDTIDIKMRYQVAESHPLHIFFPNKAEKLCKFFTLGQEKDEYSSQAKVYTIQSIEMTAKKNNKEFYIKVHKNPENNVIYLPRTVINGDTYKEGEYHYKCYDDKIKITCGKNLTFLLDEWFKIVNQKFN